MKETCPDGKDQNRLRSWASSKVHGGDRSSTRRPGPSSLLPISNLHPTTLTPSASNAHNNHGRHHGIPSPPGEQAASGSKESPVLQPPDKASAQAPGTGSQLGTDDSAASNEKPSSANDEVKANVVKRFFLTSKMILFHSWINLLLVFVPAGIAVNFVPNMSPGVIFALNAIAIIPLAGLLSQATETVAHKMGDAIGALMNITFGNAVELIILYVRAQLARGSALWQAQQFANFGPSMYVCLAKVIKTRKREKPYSGTIKSIASHILRPFLCLLPCDCASAVSLNLLLLTNTCSPLLQHCAC